jgi:hypothetical protein
MANRVKLEPGVATEARDIWREAQDPQSAPKRTPAVGFELEDNFIFIPMLDRGEFVAGVLYALGEDLCEAEAEEEDVPTPRARRSERSVAVAPSR